MSTFAHVPLATLRWPGRMITAPVDELDATSIDNLGALMSIDVSSRDGDQPRVACIVPAGNGGWYVTSTAGRDSSHRLLGDAIAAAVAAVTTGGQP